MWCTRGGLVSSFSRLDWVPFYPLFWGREFQPTKVDYRKMGSLFLTFLLEELVEEQNQKDTGSV